MLNISPALLKHTCLSSLSPPPSVWVPHSRKPPRPLQATASPTTGETGSMDRYLNNHPGVRQRTAQRPFPD